jgi:hypothetical protein
VALIYDPDFDTWNPTTPLSFGATHQGSALLPDGTVLVCGGYNGMYCSSADICNPITGVCVPTGAMITARQSPKATRLANGKVLITGGYHDSTVVSSAELYNSSIISDDPVVLMNCAKLTNGALEFDFTNSPGTLWNVLATTNASLQMDQWQLVASPVEMPPGHFQFSDLSASNYPLRFYRAIRVP